VQLLAAFLDVARQALGARHLRHGVLMMEARFEPLERGAQREDRPPALDRLDPAVGEGPAVEVAGNLVFDRVGVVAHPQEVAVHRMGRPVLRRGGGRGGEGLGDDLPAEDPVRPADRAGRDARAFEAVAAERRDGEQRDEVVDQLLQVGSFGHGRRLSSAGRRRQRSAQLRRRSFRSSRQP